MLSTSSERGHLRLRQMCNQLAPSPTSSTEAATRRPGPSLAGQRALVTGAGKGIGRAIALGLEACGAQVIGLDYDENALKELQGLMGPSGETVCVDLMDPSAIVGAVKKLVAKGGPIHLLVNNAGAAKFEPFFETDPKQFDRQYALNTRAVMVATQEVTRHLVAAKQEGSVVHVSSQSSTIALKDHLVYSSSKAAVDHMARIQALELGKYGIRVNTVRPTVVLTELAKAQWDKDKLAVMKAQIPLQRLAEAADVSNAVAWLLSSEAAMVTGQTIAVDGGRSMGGYGL